MHPIESATIGVKAGADVWSVPMRLRLLVVGCGHGCSRPLSPPDRFRQRRGVTGPPANQDAGAGLVDLTDWTMKEIATFCRHYAKDPNGAVAKLGFDRDELLGKKGSGE